MSKVTIEMLRCSRDPRGFVFEPLEADSLPFQKNAHVVMTEPGAIRGNHYHREAAEITVVVGPALVRFREEGHVWDVQVLDGEAQRFIIPPGVSHAFQNVGNKPMLLAAFSTALFNATNPDVVRDQLI